jgi:type IX secretion system PorP/SprF family membrane protein
MKTSKKIIIVLVFTLGSLTIYAQQDPMYTHYMYNTLMVNPAYAGSRDALTFTVLHRSQWIGFKGAANTQTFTMHTPLRNEHVGLGLSISNDKIGPTNNTSLFVDYSYTVKLNERSKLAFGLSAGMTIFQATLNTLLLDEQNDPAFQNNINNQVSPNFGFGAYYSKERFYAGISAPSLLQNYYSAIRLVDGIPLIGKGQRHYFFITGSLIDISDKLAFKPTVLVKITPTAPIEADLTASFIVMKRLLIGVMYRTGDAVGGLVGFDLSEKLHLGYSYDWSFGVRTGSYNSGSHELVLRYDVLFGNKQIHSPRNF